MHFNDRELLRHSAVPVLLVKTPSNYHQPVVLAAVDMIRSHAKQPTLHQHVLGTSAAIAAALCGALHAAYAYSPLPTGAVAAERAKAGFEKAVQPLKIASAQKHLIAGSSVNVIRRAAHEIDSAIVVLGAVAGSGLRRMFSGNTAERLLNRLTCDVLVVKPPISSIHASQPAARAVTHAAPAPVA